MKKTVKFIVSIPYKTPVEVLYNILSMNNNHLDKMYTCITQTPAYTESHVNTPTFLQFYGDNTYEFIYVKKLNEFVNNNKHNVLLSVDELISIINDDFIKYTNSFSNVFESIDDKQRKLDICYLRMAMEWSTNSYCVRRKVGALIVKDKRIISDGYNGTPSGFPNVCEYIPYDTKSEHTIEEVQHAEDSGITTMTHQYVLHAEANAITKLAKSQTSGEGATLYVTTSPCMECAKLIIQTGIKRVVYTQPYHDLKGIDLMQRVNIDVVQYDMELITKQQ